MDEVEVHVAENNWRSGFSDCPIYRLDKLLKVQQEVLYWLLKEQLDKQVYRDIVFHLPFPLPHTVGTGILLQQTF
jgi:hypothetical protein